MARLGALNRGTPMPAPETAPVLPETTAERGGDVAARLREAIEEMEHPGVGEAITVSIGVAAYPEDAASASELIHAADQALYVSKNSGRNRVSRYGTDRGVLRHPAWRSGTTGHSDPVAVEMRDGMADLLRPHAVDVALLPINGRAASRRVAGNLDAAEAAALARDIGARVAIPCHYEMFTFNTASPEAFVAEAERLGQAYRVLRCGERWSSGR